MGRSETKFLHRYPGYCYNFGTKYSGVSLWGYRHIITVSSPFGSAVCNTRQQQLHIQSASDYRGKLPKETCQPLSPKELTTALSHPWSMKTHCAYFKSCSREHIFKQYFVKLKTMKTSSQYHFTILFKCLNNSHLMKRWGTIKRVKRKVASVGPCTLLCCQVPSSWLCTWMLLGPLTPKLFSIL